MNRAGQLAPPRDAAHAEVASTLWREREQLEILLFTLTCQQLVLAAGNVRWLPAADERVQLAVEDVTDCELRRAIVTTELAVMLALPGDATLGEIAAVADEPWGALFAEHRDALRTLASEIDAVTRDNRRMLQAGVEFAGRVDAASATVAYPGREQRSGPVDAVLFDGTA